MGAQGRLGRVWLATMGASLAACGAAHAAEIPESGTLDLAAKADVRISGLGALSFTGFSVSRVGDVNGDGRSDIAVGAPAASARGRSGAVSVFVVFGRAESTPIDLANLGAAGYR